jgi:hypothetical protein
VVIDYIDPYTMTETPRSMTNSSQISSSRAIEISESS